MKPPQSASYKQLPGLFEVEKVDRTYRQVVPRRGAPVRPFKGIDNQAANWMKTEAFKHANLEEFIPCWSGEMASRPIPFVSTDDGPKLATDIFKKHIQPVLAYLLPQVEPHFQPINKISALGYPINGNPGTGMDDKTGIQVYESKMDVTLDLFAIMQSGDFSLYKDGFHTIGLRRQIESPKKVRVFQFIDDKGNVYQREITGVDRKIDVPQIGEMIGSRSRPITRPPVVNLYNQCWDSMLHNAILKHPLCHANVYTKERWPQGVTYMTFDCKHFERYLGMAAIEYANAIGGKYGEQLLMMIYYPFIVPSDSWKTFFEIRPLYSNSVYPQFGSGISCVADLGKLMNICVQVEFFMTHERVDERSAIALVMSGVSEGMRRWSYGDDNRVMGDRDKVEEFVKWMGTVFDIEVDETPSYLGTIYRDDIDRFVLPARTYNTKLYMPERDFEWKDYPNLGMVERRHVFQEYGEPEISGDIIPYEDELWAKVEYPYHMIATRAVTERMEANRRGVTLSRLMVTDKDYLMTEDEQVSSGLFWHLSPQVTASIVNQIVDQERIRPLLTFRDAPFTAVPKPKKNIMSYVQRDVDDTETADVQAELV